MADSTSVSDWLTDWAPLLYLFSGPAGEVEVMEEMATQVRIDVWVCDQCELPEHLVAGVFDSLPTALEKPQTDSCALRLHPSPHHVSIGCSLWSTE